MEKNDKARIERPDPSNTADVARYAQLLHGARRTKFSVRHEEYW